jgi:tRNA U34 5-methylaminomethyl-2-thiouridine-forming methyltransferase MnmC
MVSNAANKLEDENFRLVRLRSGAHSVHALDYGETMHPGLGPAAEAETLYVTQLRIAERLGSHAGTFVVWDVGLGAAANALALLRATADSRVPLQLVSFDCSLAPLRFANSHRDSLGYFADYEPMVERLLEARRVHFLNRRQSVDWTAHVGDFPSLMKSSAARWPKPDAIFFDPFSPARNPAMWTTSVFADLFAALDPGRPCSLATYSRSSMTRAALLLAGFYVGAGRAAGLKEETTVAASAPELLAHPLGRRWLERVRRSDSAEPLREPVYRKRPLSAETWARLAAHPQFQQT